MGRRSRRIIRKSENLPDKTQGKLFVVMTEFQQDLLDKKGTSPDHELFMVWGFFYPL